MPWQERSAERLRMEFIVAHESEQYTFTELCELFGISREAGYKCVRRFREDGIEGLKDINRVTVKFFTRHAAAGVATAAVLSEPPVAAR